jgi:tetratricopeptide (TPR) repeat protein
MKKMIGLTLAVVMLVGACYVKVFAATPEADALWFAGKYVEAQAQYEKDLPVLTGAEATGTQIMIGQCLAMQKKYAEAITACNKAIAATPKDVVISIGYSCVGNSATALGRTADAQAAWKSLILVKGASVTYLKEALAAIDFTEMSQNDADVLLVKAYRLINNKAAKDEDGNLIYVDYLSGLLDNMSQKAQASLVK